MGCWNGRGDMESDVTDTADGSITGNPSKCNEEIDTCWSRRVLYQPSKRSLFYEHGLARSVALREVSETASNLHGHTGNSC